MPTAAVITISDSRSAGAAVDLGGPVTEQALLGVGLEIHSKTMVPDERSAIVQSVSALIGQVDLIVTTGGTGVGPRDITPEAIGPLFARELPGFGEIMRTGSFAKTPLSIISRGGAGVSGRTLIVMLPGSPKGVKDCLELIGPAMLHVLKVLATGKMDCQGEPRS